MLLAIYLNDHLAGATVGLELARRATQNNRDSGYGAFLAELAEEIDEDRQQLLEMIKALDVNVDRLKVLAAWGGEKLGRLKLNGRMRGYSPLSRVVELEGLALGVHGKLALWRSLERVAPTYPLLDVERLETLAERAESQLTRIETHRLSAVADAMGG